MTKYVWLLKKGEGNHFESYYGLNYTSSNCIIGGIRFNYIENLNSLKVYPSKEEALKAKERALKRYENILKGNNLKGYQKQWMANIGNEMITKEYLALKNEAKLYLYDNNFNVKEIN